MLILGQVTAQWEAGHGPAGAEPAGSAARGVGIMLGSALSSQVGAGLGVHAFGAVGPAGVSPCVSW